MRKLFLALLLAGPLFGQVSNPANPIVSNTAGDLACALAADTTIGAITITGGSTTGTVATLTFAAAPPNYYRVGQLVGVTGATPSGLNGGPYTLTAVSVSGKSLSFANAAAQWSSGGTVFLWCGNQTNNAVAATPYAFANTAPGGVFSAGQTFNIRSQMTFFTTGGTPPTITHQFLYNSTFLYGNQLSPVPVASLNGVPWEMAWDIYAPTTGLLNATLLVNTMPNANAVNYLYTTLQQPTPVTAGAGFTFNLKSYYSAATTGNAVLMNTMIERP